MLICTPIQERTQKKALQRLKALKGKVDLAEIWLDHIEDLELKTLIRQAPLPVICVCRKPSEKGRFRGTYDQIAELLLQASRYGAEYIDVPLKITNSIRRGGPNKSKIQNPKSKIIISYHDFKKTPSLQTMLKKARVMYARGASARGGKKKGADIIKIAVMARSLKDTFNIISLAQLLQAEKIPHILIAMGKKGTLSRVLTPHLGGTIMFAPLALKKSTAPGQLAVRELRKAWGLIKNK